MKKNYVLGVLSVALLLSANPVDAAHHEGEHKKEGMKKTCMFEKMDKKGKGYITYGQYEDNYEDKWDKMTKNQKDDEYVVISEKVANCKKMEKCNSTMKMKKLSMMDLNGDGKVTEEEYEIVNETNFMKMDKNGDEKLQKEEYQEHMKEKMKMMGEGKGMQKGKTPAMKKTK